MLGLKQLQLDCCSLGVVGCDMADGNEKDDFSELRSSESGRRLLLAEEAIRLMSMGKLPHLERTISVFVTGMKSSCWLVCRTAGVLAIVALIFVLGGCSAWIPIGK